MVDRRRKIVWLSTRREKKASPLSRGPSTYHRCNSYNVSTQLGLGERERREEIGEGDAYLYSYRRAVRVQRERQRRRHETFTPDRQGRPYLSLFLFFQPLIRHYVSEVYRQAHVLCILVSLFHSYIERSKCTLSQVKQETIDDNLKERKKEMQPSLNMKKIYKFIINRQHYHLLLSYVFLQERFELVILMSENLKFILSMYMTI